MAEKISFNPDSANEDVYCSILPQLENLIRPEEPIISSLSNITAVLKEAFQKISWVGFYLVKGKSLFLGPFQGKIACSVIPMGKGVCGTSAKLKETIIVEDVNKFADHIACDSESKSEIVVPLLLDNELIGVLDIDSYVYSSFNEVDKKYLEELCKLVIQKLDLKNFSLS